MPPVDRRDLVFGAAALASIVPARAGPADTSGPYTEIIQLWPDKPPGGPGPTGTEQVKEDGNVSNIITPRKIMQRPAQTNGSAVLILGGGGYRRIGIEKESQTTADWLHEYGVTTFILYYRLPNDGWPLLAPFQDAQRAMRLIRAKSDSIGVDESQIGIIGYSAGGHCAGMTSMRPDADLYKAVDAVDERSARPDFAGLIYPVLTMMPPNRTRVSTLTLLGPSPTLEMSAEWSVDLHVTDDAPTTFLVHATDDPIAPVENSLLMFAALRKVHVPVEIHVFRSGGHGFNIGQIGAEGHQWPRLFATWAGFARS